MTEIPNIKPNSNKYRDQQTKEDEHRVGKVVHGTAKKKKTSGVSKFVQAFIPEDAKSIKDYIVEETPGLIQSLLRRLLQNLLDSYLPENGKYYRNTGRGGLGSNSSIRYDTIKGGNASPLGVRSRNTNTVYEYENVVFESYGDAQDVLDGLYDCLQRYEKVRVFDLYDLAEIPTNATDRNYGWTDLHGSKIISVKEGWMIDLPRAIPLY